MKKLVPFLFLALCSCARPEGKIQFEDNTSIQPLISSIAAVELVPLETDSTHLLGASPDMLLAGNDYILADRQNCRIYRYSSGGKFLNAIGEKGRANNEYANIDNIQTTDNDVMVFSRPGKMLRFSKDGATCTLREINDKGVQSYLVGSDILTYYSYSSGHPYRLALLGARDTLGFLRTKEKVMNFAGDGQVFSGDEKNGIFVLDSYSPTIYEFKDGSLDPYLSFDFGKYSIPEEFYNFKDAFQSSQYLFTRNFALVHKFFCSKDFQLVEIFVQKEKGPEFHYGLGKRGKWNWFYAGKAGEDPLPVSFRQFDAQGRLICVIDPSVIERLPQGFLRLVRNKEIINQLNANSNYVIAKITLK